MNVQQLVQKYQTSSPPAKKTGPMSVSDLVNKYQNYQAPAAPTPAAPQSFASKMFGAAKNFTTGARNALAAPVVNTVDAIDTGLNQTVGRVANAAAGKGFTPTTQTALPQTATEKLNTPAVGISGKAGEVVGTVAPYLTGAGEEEGVATGLGKLAKIATRVGTNTAIGTAQSKSLKQGAEVGIGGEVLGGISKLVGGAAKTLYKSAIPTSAAEAGLLQTYKASNTLLDRVASFIKGTPKKAPITSAETAFKQGLKGTESMLGVQAKRASTKIWNNLIKPQLQASTEKVDMNSFFDEAEAEIKAKNPEMGRQSQLLDGLNSFREDYASKKEATLEELQKFKEGWAKFIPEKSYQGKPIAGAANDVKDVLAGLARTKIYNSLGQDVKQAYFDYCNLQSIKEMGKKAMQGVKLRGGAGNFISGIKDIALTPIATIGGRMIYKTAQGLEFAGGAGAKVLSDIWNETNNAPTSPQTTESQPNQ